MVNKLPPECECPCDNILYKIIEGHLHLYHEAGLTPNMVTTIGFLCGLLAAYLIIQRHFVWAAFFWILSYYFDCVDGKLARKYNTVTLFGDYYDHICDSLKYVIVAGALIKSNTKKTTTKQWIYFGILWLLILLSCIHIGYQEIIYDQKEDSPFLHIASQIVSIDPNPRRTIQYTKYFGMGFSVIGIALIIIIWRK